MSVQENINKNMIFNFIKADKSKNIEKNIHGGPFDCLILGNLVPLNCGGNVLVHL